jgi:DNA-binding transcriptional ArsR family regulator
MEEKITLDRKAFKALASDTRVSILKSLKRQRKTLSELASEFSMSVSTVKEHLDHLAAADLVSQRDDGHKWKYYELTIRGKNVLSPGETRIWVILSASVLAACGVVYDMVQNFAGSAGFAVRDMGLENAGEGLLKSTETIPAVLPLSAGPAAGLPWFHIGLLAVSVVIFGLTLGYFLGLRNSRKVLF